MLFSWGYTYKVIVLFIKYDFNVNINCVQKFPPFYWNLQIHFLEIIRIFSIHIQVIITLTPTCLGSSRMEMCFKATYYTCLVYPMAILYSAVNPFISHYFFLKYSEWQMFADLNKLFFFFFPQFGKCWDYQNVGTSLPSNLIWTGCSSAQSL